MKPSGLFQATEGLANWVWETSFHASVLIAFVLLLQFFRQNPNHQREATTRNLVHRAAI